MAKGYSLDKGFLFSSNWETALRGLSANDFHTLFWELYDFQKSKGVTVIPMHPQNPSLDALASLIVPQIQNRLDGSIGGMVGGNIHKLSKGKISQVEISGVGAPFTAPPLSKEERQELLTKGIPETYIDERLQRAEDYALQHQKTVFDVLCDWWQEDKNKQPKQERSKRTGDLGNSFDTDDFFEAALQRSFSDLKEESK